MDLPYLTPLDTEHLRAVGIPEPWTFGMADKVRFGEIDALQHVNNAVYLKWFENLRILYFERPGFVDAVRPRPKIVLRALTLDYAGEVKLSDRYVLTGRTVSMGHTSFRQEYGVWVDGRRTTTSTASIVVLGADNRPMAIPETLREVFRDLDGSEG